MAIQSINLVGIPENPGTSVLPSVFAKEVTANGKIGPVSTTHVSQRSCPTTCPLLHSGCYAENGYIGLTITRRLNTANPEATPLQLAIEEAAAIDKLSGVRALRLHVVGDSITKRGTRILAAAVRRYQQRGLTATGHRPNAWTYTHAWRNVPREAWRHISVLASCETKSDVLEARARGYAAALVVTEHGSDKLYDMDGLKIIPCLEQTRLVKCDKCRMCWNDSKLLAKELVIGFAVHGGAGSKQQAQSVVTERNEIIETVDKILARESRHQNNLTAIAIISPTTPTVRRTIVITSPVGKKTKCSIGWCGNIYERRCGTCARRFCAGHLCDNHELRNLSYKVTPTAKLMTRQEQWMYSLRTNGHRTTWYTWHCRRCEQRGDFQTRRLKKDSLKMLAADLHWEQEPFCHGAGPLIVVKPKTALEFAINA